MTTVIDTLARYAAAFTGGFTGSVAGLCGRIIRREEA
jgi:hypothetical protein